MSWSLPHHEPPGKTKCERGVRTTETIERAGAGHLVIAIFTGSPRAAEVLDGSPSLRVVHGDDVKGKQDQGKALESAFCPVVDHHNRKKSHPKPPEVEIGQEGPANLSERRENPAHHQRETEPAKIEVRFEIRVVRLIRMKPVLGPHQLGPVTQPETLEAGTEDWIDVDIEDGGPQLRSPGQRGVAPESAD